MSELYGKEILKHYSFTFQGRLYTVYVLNDDKYYNIHIISKRYKEDELNTLCLQEPKDSVSIDSFTDIKMACLGLEFALWDEFYGYDKKLYSFSVDVAEETEI